MKPSKRTFTIADDELSRLVRTIEIEPAADGPVPLARRPIVEVLENLLAWLCDQLTAVGWPDPTSCLVLRNGEWGGNTIDPIVARVQEPPPGVEHVLSATAIRQDLEGRGLAFGDTWYCAAMIENILAALAGQDEQRPYALIAVGWWLRDWQWRKQYGQNARGKRRQNKATRKAREARAINNGIDPDWHEDARQEARILRAKNPKRSRWNIAGALAGKFGVSQKQVSKVIKSSVR